MAARQANCQVILNNYFTGTLGIGDQGLRDALNAQGLTSFNAVVSLKDDDIQQICSNIRKPGGTIANPNVAVAGQPHTIQNPGIAVGHVI
jgi:predicted flap endonuclease-1-like 5' DNA nuclease